MRFVADWRSDFLLLACRCLLVNREKLGGTPILGITSRVTLVSPQLMNAYLIGKSARKWDFGLFAIEKSGLPSSGYPRYFGWCGWPLLKIT